MIIPNVSQGSVCGLPHQLSTAQAAIHLPEVQEMLHKLSQYNLGIFMPHRHDGQTGEFQALPDGVTQVESGLEVSFLPTRAIDNHAARFLPVGWIWRTGVSAAMVCEMVRNETPGETQRYDKHKMVKGIQQTP